MIAADINNRLVGTMPAIKFEEVHNLMFDNEKYLNIAKMIATEQTRILKEKEKSKIKETVQHKTKPKGLPYGTSFRRKAESGKLKAES